MMRREVAFEISTGLRYETRIVSCEDAPTLTASGAQIKSAGDVNSMYQLYMEEPGTIPDRQIGDCEAVAFPPDRRLRFFATPSISGG